MHYYQFNIGDYSSHTARLSPIEDLAYRRLLDGYYLNERPFNGCSTDVAREIGLLDYQSEVDYVLNKFFTNSTGDWTQSRVEQEISAYHGKQKSASKAGKASAKARQAKASEQTFNDRSTDVQPTIKHKPLNINQEPLNNNQLITAAEPPKPKQKRFVEPSLEDVRQYFFEKGETQSAEPQKFHDFYTSNGWKVSNNKMKCWKASVRNWISRNKSGGSNATYKQTNQPTIDPNDTSWGDEFITTGSEQGNAQPSERDIQGFEGDSLSMETGAFIGFDRGRH